MLILRLPGHHSLGHTVKHLAHHPNPEHHQPSGEVQKYGGTFPNHRGELVELRFLISETLSVRCECYLSANAWLILRDSPLLRSIARKTIEKILSDRSTSLGESHEKSQRR